MNEIEHSFHTGVIADLIFETGVKWLSQRPHHGRATVIAFILSRGVITVPHLGMYIDSLPVVNMQASDV